VRALDHRRHREHQGNHSIGENRQVLLSITVKLVFALTMPLLRNFLKIESATPTSSPNLYVLSVLCGLILIRQRVKRLLFSTEWG